MGNSRGGGGAVPNRKALWIFGTTTRVTDTGRSGGTSSRCFLRDGRWMDGHTTPPSLSLRIRYLSEKEVRVRAVPPLLLPPLQQHQRPRHRSVSVCQAFAQPPAVLGEQSGRHPEGVLTQPVDGPERTAGTGGEMDYKVGKTTEGFWVVIRADCSHVARGLK